MSKIDDGGAVMTDLLALAERVEALTDQDREVDVLILTQVAGYRDIMGDGSLFDRGNDGYWTLDGDERNRALPSPTTSLDAAMTLVPEGWVWQISNRAPKPHTGRAYLHNGELIFAGIGSRPNPEHKSVEVVAATPARALTAEAQRDGALDTLQGGLELLLAAVKAGDPSNEIEWRVQEELRQIFAIRAAAKQKDGG